MNLDTNVIETQASTDYEDNINTCIDGGFDVVVTVGFLIEGATREAAEANPDVYFIGVDQFGGPENFTGILSSVKTKVVSWLVYWLVW